MAGPLALFHEKDLFSDKICEFGFCLTARE